MSTSPLTKPEFLSQLESKLMVLPDNERKNALDYYDKFIESSTDQAAAIAGLGAPGEVAADILASYVKRESHATPVPNTPTPESGGISHTPVAPPPHPPVHTPVRRSNYWWIIAIVGILAAPALFGVVIGLGGGLFGLFVGLWSIIFAFAVSGVVFLATGAASLALSIFIFFQDTGFGLQAAGMGLVLMGCGILFIKLTVAIARWLISLVKWGIAKIRGRFHNERAI